MLRFGIGNSALTLTLSPRERGIGCERENPGASSIISHVTAIPL